MLVFFLLIWVSVSSNAGWRYPITNYTRRMYHAATQNWMLIQHDNGWMYAANNSGLLEFDGMNWRTYSVRKSKMRAVNKGEDGRIYIGGMSHFGYFEPDGLGGLRYHQMSDSLQAHMNLGVVRNILVDGANVYFQADRYIFYKKDGQVRFIDNKIQIQCAALFNHNLYITSDAGLFSMEGEQLVPVHGAESLRSLGVVSMFAYKNKLFFVTRSSGIFVYDGFKLYKYASTIEPFLLRKQLYCATLKGSLLALGSVQDGICLLDLESGQARYISTAEGLQSKTVNGLLFDKEGNLWAALDNGIDYIQTNANLLPLYGDNLLIGSGYSSFFHQGKLYLGTIQGIYCTELADDAPIKFIHGTAGQAWSFLSYGDELFCASGDGVFLIDKGSMKRIGNIKGVRSLAALPNRENTLIAGTYGVNRGLYLLKKQRGVWGVTAKIENCDISCKSLLSESPNTLWITNKGRGVIKLWLSDDLRKVVREQAYNKFPMDYDAQLSRVRGEIVVSSQYGLYKFDAAKDSLLEHRELEQMLDGKAPYTYCTEDAQLNIWYVAKGTLKLKRYDKRQRKYPLPAQIILGGNLMENFESVSIQHENAIISTEDGFSKMNLSEVQGKNNFQSLSIRYVYLTGQQDSLVYGRNYHDTDKVITIPYIYNSLRIEYSAVNYASAMPAQFSYRLSKDNKDGTWSEYSPLNTKEFTDLAEGKYTFSVRLLGNGTDGDSQSASFSFEVLPPWYRTWWSFLLYAVIAILLLYGTYRRIIHHQRETFKRESDIKDQRIDFLQEENLQAELRYKSEELIHTTLNIVRKNEILLEIQKEVDGISNSLKTNDMVALHRQLIRLKGQIATNIAHDDDLQVFKKAFDSVHHNFFQQLEKSYPNLHNKEKLLCAYIKMDLLTKEIAPLLNLSTRGVEICRYRLRKKLGLKERENLADFLNNIG